MMRTADRLLRLPEVFLILSLLSIALPNRSFATSFDNKPKILLHVRSVTTKSPCTTWGELSNCQNAVSQAKVGNASGPFYYMYILVATGANRSVALGGNGLGIAGVQCGITYNNALSSGVDIFSWTLCATLEFSSSGWPASGGGNLVTWDSTNKCQKGEVAIAGYFYCGAYSEDKFSLTARPVDGAAKVADCNSVEIPLDSSRDLGDVVFSNSGQATGFNPCVAGSGLEGVPSAPATPIVTPGCGQITVTWGGVATATAYRIYRDGIPLVVVNGSPYIDTNPTTLAPRCYRVSAINGSGEGPQSPSADCATALSVPDVAGIPDVVGGCGLATISFAAVARATGYRIYRDGVPLVFVGGSPYTDTSSGSGIQRCYRVAATNSCGEGPQSPQAVCVTPRAAPAPPGTPIATADCGQISLAWSAATGATSYKVYRDGIPIATVGGSPYLDVNPTTISPRCYRVSAVNECGESAQSALASCATAIAVPPAPEAPLLAIGCGQITVNWSAVSGAASYKVYRDGVPVASVGLPPYVDTNPTTTNQRCYRISAVNGCGESGQSAQAVCGLAGSAPAAPATPTTVGGCGQITLSWPAVGGAGSYKIFRDGIAVAIVGGSPWVDTNPSIGIARCYRISALSDCGESAQSAQASCATAGLIPGAPATLTATAGCGKITLTWDPVSGATNYRIYRDGIPLVTTGGPPWDDTNPTSSAPRFYRVSALTDCGESGQSAQASCATAADLPSAPGTPVATAGCNEITLTWSTVSGSISYKVYRDGIPIATVGGSPYSDTSLSTQSQRCYRVSAIGGCGEGAQSPEASCALALASLGMPTITRAVSSCSSVRLEWTGVAGAMGYKIYRDGISIVTISNESLIFEDTDPGAVQRCYRVAAFNSCGEGAPSEVLCGGLLKPPHPTQVEPPAGAPGVTVTIQGTDFGPAVSGTGITFSGSGGQLLPAVVSDWSDTEIRCVVPVGSVSGGVTVTNACGSTTSLAWTPVQVTGLAAAEREGVVELVWEAVGESEGIRFDVYRHTENTDPVRLNGEPLIARRHNQFLDYEVTIPGFYVYTIWQVNRLGQEQRVGEVGLEIAGLLARSFISSVQPNPVRQFVDVDFEIATDESLSIAVFDVQGRQVGVLTEGVLGRGKHHTTWNCRQANGQLCSPGLYVVRLVTGTSRSSRKIVVSR